MTDAPRWAHQAEDTARLLQAPAFALFHEPGLGKTRTVIDAVPPLLAAGAVDSLVVVAPASARSVWVDPDPVLGEVAKWWPRTLPLSLAAYTAKLSLGRFRPAGVPVLVTNPEFVRRADRLDPLLRWMDARRTLLVADESWAYQNATADQTKALWKLGGASARRVILNGTPGEIKQLYGQYRILAPALFPGVRNWWQFRGRYCRLGGWMGKEITGYQRETEFRAVTAPITSYRQTVDCRDVLTPARLTLDAALTPATWRIYKDMRETLLADLAADTRASAAHAGAKVLRLAQIVNGFVGGVEPSDEELFTTRRPDPVAEIGTEKLTALVRWLQETGVPDKLIIFTRFRADVERTVRVLATTYPGHEVRPLYGGVSATDAEAVKRLFAPGGDPRPAIGVVNAQSGGAGLNLAQASTGVFLGHEFSRRIRVQAEGRLDRPGQTRRVTFVDVVASGPAGEHTIDATILAAQRRQEETAAWTAAMWREQLTREAECA